MKKPKLTKQQVIVFEYIKESIATRGYAPSLREICKRIGSESSNGARDHLNWIAKKGYIEVTPFVARGIKVLP